MNKKYIIIFIIILFILNLLEISYVLRESSFIYNNIIEQELNYVKFSKYKIITQILGALNPYFLYIFIFIVILHALILLYIIKNIKFNSIILALIFMLFFQFIILISLLPEFYFIRRLMR